MRILLLGALGEVGAKVAERLSFQHEIVRATGRPEAALGGVVTLDEACSMVRAGAVDAVVNASGPGDRRARPFAADASTALARASASAGTPAIALSTTRVLEGTTDPECDEAAEASPLTPYASANAAHERTWLDGAGDGGAVLRLVNVLVLPGSADSPQLGLLPWSLAQEARSSGTIGIRSSADLGKQFVDAGDIAAAITLIASEGGRGVLAAAPGATLTLRDLAEAVADAFVDAGADRPSMSFGSGGATGPRVRPGWLAEHGWRAAASTATVRTLVGAWLAGRLR